MQWVLVLAILVFVGGCLTQSKRKEEFLIYVDSISHPDTVEAYKTFELKLYGNIGPDGCYRFSRYVTKRSEHAITIWAIGEKFEVQQVNCPDIIPSIDGHVLRIAAPDSGRLELRVVNPGLANVLQSSIAVKPADP